MRGSFRQVRLPLTSAMEGRESAKFLLPPTIADMLEASPSVVVPTSRNEIVHLVLGGPDVDECEVSFSLPQGGRVVDAKARRNGNAVEVRFADPALEKKDQENLLVASASADDEICFADRFGVEFEEVRPTVLDILIQDQLVAVPFRFGSDPSGVALAILPQQAAFFALGLEAILDPVELARAPLRPRVIVFNAPVVRHTHCAGRPIAVHVRNEDCHEIYALYLLGQPSVEDNVVEVLRKLENRNAPVAYQASRRRRVRRSSLRFPQEPPNAEFCCGVLRD